MHLKLSLHRKTKVIRVGVETLTPPPLSAEHQETTTFQPWEDLSFNPAINNQPHQNIMKSTHLEVTDVTDLHAADWCLPVQIMRALWDPGNDTANSPAPMLEVQSTGEGMLHCQSTKICVTTSHPHCTQNSSSQMIQIPLKKTSQQLHWKMRSGLKVPFQIDICVFMKHLNQITSVPTPALIQTQTLGWTYHNHHTRMQQYLDMR